MAKIIDFEPQPNEVLELLTDPDILQDMHAIAERTDLGRAPHHALVEVLAERAFGKIDVEPVSLGVQLQEAASELIPCEPGNRVIYTRDGLLHATPQRAQDIFLDILPWFKNSTRIHNVVVAAGNHYYRTEGNRGRVLAGAALSHALMLGRRHSTET